MGSNAKHQETRHGCFAALRMTRKEKRRAQRSRPTGLNRNHQEATPA